MGTYVRPEGDLLKAKLIIVGEQPGRTEIQSGRPFVGPAGIQMNECLKAVGLMRTDCYITNFVKDLDAPIESYLNLSNGSFSERGLNYRTILLNEIRQSSATVVIAMGHYAMTALTGITKPGITKWRGSVLPIDEIPGKYVIPTFHPATILPPKFQYLNKFLIQLDLKKAKQISENGFNAAPRELIIGKSHTEYCHLLDLLRIDGAHGLIVYFDIEIYNEEVSCISFSTSADKAFSIPFVVWNGPYFTPQEELNIMLRIAIILEDAEITKCGQNLSFDAHFLLRKYGIATRNMEDTMIAQNTIMPDYPKGLDFITSVWTDHKYYKDEGKKYFAGGGWEQLWRYNATDSLICAEAFPKQEQKLKEQGNLEVYMEQAKLIPPLVYMQERGIKMDTEGMMRAAEKANEEVVALQDELNVAAGMLLNPNSPKQLKDYFYAKKGFRAYKSRHTGEVTVDETAMKRIARQGVKEAQLILDIRKRKKMVSTYLNMEKVDPDGRIRCSYNPAGTRFSRLSSSSNIFGTGMNLQNWPHSLHCYMLVDEGYVAYRIDLSQAENRIVAYEGNIPPMISCFENEEDVHSLTAGLLLGKNPVDVSREDGSSPLGDGTHSERDWGKKANHCKLKTCDVLTPSGWTSIQNAFITNTEIAQWDKQTGEISFVIPSKWFTDIYTGEIHTIQNQRIFQEATPEHRMPLKKTDRGNDVIELPIKNYFKNGHYGSPLSGQYLKGYLNFPDCLTRLIVAFQADGTWNSSTITFKLQKSRKITRLTKILDTLMLPYTTPSYGTFNISARHPVTKYIRELLGERKLFGSWLLTLSKETLDVFLEELPHWDGYRKKNSYFTTSRINAEWIQTITHLCNKAAKICEQDNSKTEAFGNKVVYRLRIRDTINPATHAIKHTKHNVTNQRIYCPTVPTGFFLVREKGLISVTGNSLNYDLGYRAFALIFEMQEKQAAFIVNRYHMAYPGVRNNYHANIRNSLKQNRTVTNLMGRHTLFMDQWGDALFKDAYACIPQGTVGDIMNKRGLNYIYYNEEFAPVELLLQVHDDVTFQMPLSIGLRKHAELLLKIKQSLETPLTTSWGMDFVIPADTTVCVGTLSKEDGVDIKGKKMPTNIDELTALLTSIVNK